MVKDLITFDGKTTLDSISSILGINSVYIEHFIRTRAFSYRSVDDVNIKEFINYIRRFYSDLSLDNLSIASVSIHHLTNRLSLEHIDSQSFYNLHDVLTKETDLRNFLLEYGFDFLLQENKVIVKYKGNILNWENYNNTTVEPTARMLQRRFEGSSLVSVDKCINGFLFFGNIQEHSDVRHLIYGPEILQNLCYVLGRMDIVEKWRNKSNTYIVTYKVAFADMLFDSNSDLNPRQKVSYLLKHCLYYLCIKYREEWDENYNPIIRIKDKLSLPRESILRVTEIEFSNH